MRSISRRIAAMLVIVMLVAMTPVSMAYAAPSTGSNLTCVTFPTTSVGYAAGEGGLIRKTSDGGVTWSNPLTVPTSLWSKTITGIAFWDEQTGIVVTSDKSSYRTSNGGTSWAENAQMQYGDGVRANAVAAPYKGASTYMSVMAAGDANPTDEVKLPPQIWGWGVANPGEYWGSQPSYSVMHTYDPDFYLTEGLGDFYGLDFVSGTLHGWAVGVDAWTGIDVYTGTKSQPQAIVARSTDGGWNWQKQTLPVSSATLRGVSFADTNNGVAVGTGGAVFQTANGGTTWTDRKSAGFTSSLNGVALATATQGWAVGTGGVIRKTLDGGATWAPFTSGTSANLTAIAHVSGTTFVVVGGAGTILRLTDGVTPPNTPPVLGAIGNKAVNELSQLAFTATATDPDLPAQTLTFSLGAGAPSGAAITAGGAFTWTPTETQGPGSYPVTVAVSDGALTDTETFTVTVAEVNVAPVLAPIGAKAATVGVPLSFQVSATDADLPANTLTYGAADVPAGAAFTPSTRTFSFTPAAAGTYPVTFTVSDGHGGTDAETISVTASAAPAQVVLVPIFGPNRYATAIAASKKAFPEGSEYVIVATGMNWPDALGGSALAGALDAPILLTATSSLPAEVRAEIVRLGATKAIVLGGTPAVSAAVMGQIDAISGVGVERISGPNRYDTANAVAARTIAVLGGGYDGTAFIATGANFPDALGASPLAAAKGWPIYLANPNQGDNAGLVAVMKAAGVTDAILLGGANVVSDAIKTPLGTTYATRLAGANRYDTAVKVAEYGVANAGLVWDRVALATGENFPDALAGGVLQGLDGSVLLLTPTNSLNDGVAAVLRTNKPSILEVRFLGSTAAVSQAVRTAVWNILKR